MNQYYSEELSQKTKRGLHETRLKGKYSGGRINFGYALEGDKIVINEEEAAIVRGIFNDYINGKSIYAITRELNEKGLRNRDRPFLCSTLYTMLNREKYYGVYRMNGYTYTNIFPAIVSEEVYKAAYGRLLENSVGKHIPDVTYLLRGKVNCGYCGKRLTSFGGRDRGGKQRRYYKCYGTPHCPCKSIKKELLEGIVSDALNKALRSPEDIDFLVSAIIDSIRQRNEENATLRLLESEMDKTEKTIDNIMTAIKMGIVTETTKAALEECEETRKTLSEKIHAEKSKQKPLPSREQIRNYILSALQRPSKAMIDLLVYKVVVFNDKVEITFKYSNGSSDQRPKKLNKHMKRNPDLDDSRGPLFMSYEFSYTKTVQGKQFTDSIRVYFYIK